MAKVLSIAVLLLFSTVASAQDAKQASATTQELFRSLLSKGIWAVISESGSGYQVTLYAEQPDMQAAANANVEVRFAELNRRIAQSDLEKALNANRLQTNSVPEDDVQRLRLSLERATLQLELATQQASSVAYRIAEVGNDCVVLETEEDEVFVPLNAIRHISRKKTPGRVTGSAQNESPAGETVQAEGPQ